MPAAAYFPTRFRVQYGRALGLSLRRLEGVSARSLRVGALITGTWYLRNPPIKTAPQYSRISGPQEQRAAYTRTRSLPSDGVTIEIWPGTIGMISE
jgi:hypothetical protein